MQLATSQLQRMPIPHVVNSSRAMTMALVMALVLIAPITQTFGTLPRTNNDHTIARANVDPDADPDADASTFNSSRARLNLPTGGSVESAGL